MEADEARRSRLHAREIEVLFHPPHIRLGKRGPSSRDLVDVGASDGIVARVKLVADLLGEQDVDVRGQFVVDSAAQRLGWNRGVNVEMRDLRERMHAGIGAA
jgi:hypothetical protein